MNILPLILALVFMIAVITVEQLEKHKNNSVVQLEFQEYLKLTERVVFNLREKALINEYQKNIRQITFRYFYDKTARNAQPNAAKQYRLLTIELMKILYGHTSFFKEMESKRPKFLDELLTAIETASDNEESMPIKRPKDLAHLDLGDPDLQSVFYHMLKGNMVRTTWLEMEKEERVRWNLENVYFSLFTFINDFGAKAPPTIRIALAPRETLQAIFVKDEVVEDVLQKRKELGGQDKTSGADAEFKSEFIGKIRPGIEENLLDFSLSKESAEHE